MKTLLASENYRILYLLTYEGEHLRMHVYYFHSYAKFISAKSDLSFSFTHVQCMDKRHLQANNKVASQTAHTSFADTFGTIMHGRST